MSKKTIGPFQLEAKLGVGGMGVVYRATYVKTGQKVALKVLTPALSTNKKVVARFEREMNILKKLKHPNIIQYYGGGRDGDQLFYAMRLMEGGSLDDVLEQKGRLPWEQAIDYGKQICAALDHAHGMGVIHRDIKPANLFLTDDEKLALGDFGIARDNEATALTAAGMTVGTFGYMAPEQITGKPPVSRKTDLYALGCVLFQMVTGRLPYVAETQAEMLYQHLEEDPPRVASLAIDCPIWLEDIIMQLLEKDPEKRPYDAPFVGMALDEVGKKVAAQASVSTHVARGGKTSANIAATSPELAGLLKKKKKKKKQQAPVYEQAWFLAGCLLLVIVGVVWLLWPPSEAKLFAAIPALMETEDQYKWIEARPIMEKYLNRFPDGEHAVQVRDYMDKIEMQELENRLLRKVKFDSDADSEAERKFLDAFKLERFGDRLTASRMYQSLADLFKDDDKAWLYVKLANQHAADLRSKATDAEADAGEYVNSQLELADKSFHEGKVLEAEDIWRGIDRLYRSDPQFAERVAKARRRLGGDMTDPDPNAATGNAAEPTQTIEAPQQVPANATNPGEAAIPGEPSR